MGGGLFFWGLYMQIREAQAPDIEAQDWTALEPSHCLPLGTTSTYFFSLWPPRQPTRDPRRKRERARLGRGGTKREKGDRGREAGISEHRSLAVGP